jgi:hypothetical protein
MIVGLRSKAGNCGPRMRGPYPFALLAFIALLGFAASHAIAGVAPTAAALSTTVPPPDPPRSTTPKPDVVPPAPPRHPRRPVAPPPPPPAVAPPPAAVAPLSPTSAPTITQSRTTGRVTVRPRSTKPRIETPPAARSRPKPPHLRERRVFQAPSSSALLAPRASSSSALPLLLLLVFAAGTSLVLVGVAVAPPWALPRLAVLLVSDRRETVAVAGVAVAVSTGLGLLLALMVT